MKKPDTQISTQLTFQNGELVLPVIVDAGQETVWLNRQQMAKLFDRDVKTIGRHISNALREELEDSVVANFATTAADGKTYLVAYYNLDMIISVGYRVKSARGVQFRRWANGVLRQYLMQGYAANTRRLEDLSCVLNVMRRVESQLDSAQVLDVVQQYAASLRMLDDYDHQRLAKPEAAGDACRITYRECRELIDAMSYGAQSSVFGNEKDDSFKGSINAIYQSFNGKDLYPSSIEKGANLLYLVTKNHSFSDGNKRIAAAVFLHFLQRNGLLFRNGEKVLADHTLVAMVVMIAESKPEEKETMVKLVMNFLTSGE